MGKRDFGSRNILSEHQDKRRDFWSGRLSEKDSFGEFKPGLGYEVAYKQIANERGYVNFIQAMTLVREHGNPKVDATDPSKPLARELRIAVIDELGLEDKDQDRIKFFSAVGTALDHFHGVDGWIEFQPEEGPPVIVTLDVTLNTKKLEHKADIIISEVPDPDEDEKAFEDLVYQTYAPQVAKRLAKAVQQMLKSRTQEVAA